MSEAPERIYADRGPKGGWLYRAVKMPDTEHVYVRADIAEREAAELRTEVEIQRASKEYAQQCCDHTEARAEDLSRQLAERDAELARDERSKLRLAFRKALTALPEIAPPEISAILSSVQMRDEFLNEGKRLQEKHGTVAVAPRVEQECGAGAWSFMREGVRAALSGSGDGWRIIRDDETHAPTVERCVAIAVDIGQTQAKGWRDNPSKDGCGGEVAASNTGHFIATAIRALIKEGGE